MVWGISKLDESKKMFPGGMDDSGKWTPEQEAWVKENTKMGEIPISPTMTGLSKIKALGNFMKFGPKGGPIKNARGLAEGAEGLTKIRNARSMPESTMTSSPTGKGGMDFGLDPAAGKFQQMASKVSDKAAGVLPWIKNNPVKSLIVGGGLSAAATAPLWDDSNELPGIVPAPEKQLKNLPDMDWKDTEAKLGKLAERAGEMVAPYPKRTVGGVEVPQKEYEVPAGWFHQVSPNYSTLRDENPTVYQYAYKDPKTGKEISVDSPDKIPQSAKDAGDVTIRGFGMGEKPDAKQRLMAGLESKMNDPNKKATVRAQAGQTLATLINGDEYKQAGLDLRKQQLDEDKRRNAALELDNKLKTEDRRSANDVANANKLITFANKDNPNAPIEATATKLLDNPEAWNNPVLRPYLERAKAGWDDFYAKTLQENGGNDTVANRAKIRELYFQSLAGQTGGT
jgi:hypothetical protein